MTEHHSLIYSNRILYQLAIRFLYGNHYQDRYRALADIIPEQCSVVDLCCGDCYLYTHYLKSKKVSYLGLDLSPSFVAAAHKQGINARRFDVWVDPIPAADIIMMEGSLYQFIPHADQVIQRMLASAKQKVLVAEPINNLSTAAIPVLAAIGRLTPRPCSGANPFAGRRFVQQSMLDLFNSFEAFDHYFLIPGGREMVGIFIKHSDPIE
jgi:trans-aconitate methyltransferase